MATCKSTPTSPGADGVSASGGRPGESSGCGGASNENGYQLASTVSAALITGRDGFLGTDVASFSPPPSHKHTYVPILSLAKSCSPKWRCASAKGFASLPPSVLAPSSPPPPCSLPQPSVPHKHTKLSVSGFELHDAASSVTSAPETGSRCPDR
ncbi:unnamed protein product [Pleuronectes platessa]|uniref:Uncharacterized protein n=1 Tax=Pleuronectes platessa TaxID=8262 RepID=A0A9N7URX6_PLEPL|nr:unnamed protein product [Pleuronectes platessa]